MFLILQLFNNLADKSVREKPKYSSLISATNADEGNHEDIKGTKWLTNEEQTLKYRREEQVNKTQVNLIRAGQAVKTGGKRIKTGSAKQNTEQRKKSSK